MQDIVDKDKHIAAVNNALVVVQTKNKEKFNKLREKVTKAFQQLEAHKQSHNELHRELDAS